MTRRIMASFLAVLVVVIAALVVPLGLIVTAQQRDDFRDSAGIAARGYAALVEEQLGDQHRPGTVPATLAAVARSGDQITVLDAGGAAIAEVGQRLPTAVLNAARTHRQLPGIHDRVITSASVGDTGKPTALVIVARDTATLHQRARTLWLVLGAAAAGAILISAAVGWSLGRWIVRPLGSLQTAAHGIGAGRSETRADQGQGPAQVREVAAAFNDMADRVAGLLETQRRMTAEVSHQLRTPLSAMRLRLELLAEEAQDQFADDLNSLLEETNRLSRLVDGLLAVARAEAITPTPVPTDVDQIVAERIAAWEPVASERGLIIGHNRFMDSWAAVTPGHLDQILDNLLANAIEATPAGGQLTVAVQHDREHIVLLVDDTGPGMPPEQRAHAFDRFRADRNGHGSIGIGLSIVGRLLAVDHGSARLSASPGGGTRVEVRLPRAIGPR